jgi:hypothetical protein
MGHLTMSHLDERDPKLIAHIVITWAYSLFFYAILYYYYRLHAEVRMHWLNRNTPRTYTIILLNIPEQMRFKRAIKEWFEDHFRTKVSTIDIIRNGIVIVMQLLITKTFLIFFCRWPQSFCYGTIKKSSNSKVCASSSSSSSS